MRLAIGIGAWICAAAVTAAPLGYLRSLGPAPLRFQSLVTPVAAVSLPPLAMSDKPDTNAPPAAANASTNAAPSAVTAPENSVSQPASTNIPPTVVIQEPSPRTSAYGMDLPKVIEMLMPMHGSTNTTGSTIMVMPSVPFTPPLPSSPSTSSATYESPPAPAIKTP